MATKTFSAGSNVVKINVPPPSDLEKLIAELKAWECKLQADAARSLAAAKEVHEAHVALERLDQNAG